ncbi:MAG: dihydrofolate reductase family protein [Saprospiraceae bacterium]|nr:dihydrofolate reductase family protein [Saprospiraceae bacterium]
MKQLILYTAASLDGFLARPDGDIGWLHDPAYTLPGEDYGYEDLNNRIDTVLMGYKTYAQILGFDQTPSHEGKRTYVFTRSNDRMDRPEVTFISENVVDFVRQLKVEKGKDIWLIGGGEINALLLDHDLIDQIILSYIPIFLGEGIPLFNGKTREAKFDLTSCHSYESGLTQLILSRKF